MEDPLLWGLKPSQRIQPAFPIHTLLISAFPTSPMVAQQLRKTIQISPDGKRKITK